MHGNIFEELLFNVSLLLSLSILYEISSIYPKKPKLLAPVLNGVIISIVGLVLMSFPFTLVTGIVFDTRSILISVTALTFGTIPTVISASILILYRLSMGGMGVWMGVLVLVFSAGIGLFWRRYLLKQTSKNFLLSVYLFGLIVHVVMLVCAFAMPLTNAINVIKQISLPVITIYPIGTVLFSVLLLNQQKRKNAQQLVQDAERRYRLLFENAVETILVVQDEKIKLYSPMAKELTGYSDKQLGSLSFLDLLHAEDIPYFPENYEKLVSQEKTKLKYVFQILRKDGQTSWVEMNSIRFDWEEKPATLNFIQDITKRKLAEEALKKSEEKYRLLTEFASDVIWVYNLALNKFTYISPAIFNLRGYTIEEALQESLQNCFMPDSYATIKNNIIDHVSTFTNNPDAPNHYINEVRQPCKDGRIIWVEISVKYRYNAEHEIEIVGVSRNIDDRKQAEKEVLYLSYHDLLTDLYNRRYYEQEMQRLDDEAYFPLTLIMADVNGLKLTNDAFGHIMGDILLQKMARILKSECRSQDIIARIGGDEFVLLLPRTDLEDAKKIIERISAATAYETVNNIILSVSMGFAIKYDHSTDMNEIFMQAEDDMYRHKLSESSSMRSQTIDLIMNSLYEKNNREMLHSKRVSQLCEAIAIKLNLSKDEINQIRIAGLMHDIGKIGIDEKILNNPKKLNTSDWKEIKRHSEIGYRILSSVNEFSEIAEYVLAHHEKLDGSGYPKGLKGDEISLQARIITISDAYDAMTSDRAYRKALSEEETIAELKANANKQFDAGIAKVFVEQVLGKPWQNN